MARKLSAQKVIAVIRSNKLPYSSSDRFGRTAGGFRCRAQYGGNSVWLDGMSVRDTKHVEQWVKLCQALEQEGIVTLYHISEWGGVKAEVLYQENLVAGETDTSFRIFDADAFRSESVPHIAKAKKDAEEEKAVREEKDRKAEAYQAAKRALILQLNPAIDIQWLEGGPEDMGFKTGVGVVTMRGNKDPEKIYIIFEYHFEPKYNFSTHQEEDAISMRIAHSSAENSRGYRENGSTSGSGYKSVIEGLIDFMSIWQCYIPN